MRKPARSSRRFTFLLVLSVIVVLAASLVFNRNGLIAIVSLLHTTDTLRVTIDSLRNQADSLREETIRLQSDSAFMEKAVREILGWGRPDEFVIRIVEPVEEGSE